VANRVTKQFSKDSQAAIEQLIKKTLDIVSTW
jgi:uridine phosphorylase